MESNMVDTCFVLCCMFGADSRHSNVAAIYDDMSELLTSWLIWQFKRVGCP